MKYLLVIALLGGGCTCLTKFDPESQPCELSAPPGEQCLSGYECRSTGEADGGICKRSPDGG